MFTFTLKEKLLQMSIEQSLTTPVNLATYIYVSNVFFEFCYIIYSLKTSQLSYDFQNISWNVT